MIELSQMSDVAIVESILEMGIARENAEGDADAFNKASEPLDRLRSELERRGSKAQQQLLPYLQSPNAAIQLTVATVCLGFAPDEALAVLDALADLPPMVHPSESMKAKLLAKFHRAYLHNRAHPDAKKNWWEF